MVLLAEVDDGGLGREVPVIDAECDLVDVDVE